MELDQTILITQARTGSTRLPNKVLLKINGDELLKIHLTRLKACKEISQIIVATTIDPNDDLIVDLCNRLGFDTYRGAVNDVLDRFYQSVKHLNPAWIVRVTSDCPLIDPELVDAVIKLAKVNDVDYASNILLEHFPDGQDVEVFKFSALEKAWKETILMSDREHVTPFIRSRSTYNGGHIFKSVNFPCPENFSQIRMTVDEPLDFELILNVLNDLGTNRSWLEYTRHIIANNYNNINSSIARNEGFLKSLQNDQHNG